MKDDLKKTNKLKEFLLSHKYAAWLLLWIVFLAWYIILNKSSVTFHDIHISIDDKLPFLEGFVVFYILWFPLIAASFLYTLFKSRKDFLTLVSLIFIPLFSSMIICTVYPSEVSLRPTEMNDNFFTWIVSIIYAVDNPRNVFPSMHCIVAIVIAVCCIFAESTKGKVLLKVIISIIGVGICMSTFFIKQHSFADFLLALVMCVPTVLITYLVIVPRISSDKKEDSEEAPVGEPFGETADALLFMSNDEGADASAEVAADEVTEVSAEPETTVPPEEDHREESETIKKEDEFTPPDAE